MIFEVFSLLVGLILLVKGSDLFVKSAASIAKKFGVSEFIIGLTLIAAGTSLPELMSAIFASIRHESGLVMGNIVGANIANIGLVIGIAAIISVIKTNKEMLWRDGYFLLFIALLLLVLTFNGVISRLEGALLILLYFAYTIFLFEEKPRFKGKYHFKDFITYFYKFQYLKTIKSKLVSGINNRKKKSNNFKSSIIKELLMLIISGVLLVVGANYLVENAIFFANMFDVPKTVMGIMIAIGTTMPEMSVAITAVRKGYGNIVIGNALGSCITNTLLILGVAALIFPLTVTTLSKLYTIPFMMFMVLLLLIFLKSEWKIRRWEGLTFLVLYVLFLLVLLLEIVI
jgi:cation:H+ antiporter